MYKSTPDVKVALISLLIVSAEFVASAQNGTYTHADSLRGAINPQRAWWDLVHYDIEAEFNPGDSSITGSNTISYKVLSSSNSMQIDLQEPLLIDSVIQSGKKLKFERDGNAFFVSSNFPPIIGSIESVVVYYHGRPRAAVRPPWDGGVIWTKDRQGRTWITIACQGLGASVWVPCKDHQADEPDSVKISITHTDDLRAVSNGRLKNEIIIHRDRIGGHERQRGECWVVKSPINNYDIIPYIGHYQSSQEKYSGEKGSLDVSYWLMDYTSADEKVHLRENVNKTLKNLEHWFGPYPFYNDSYKIVEAPHLGMEHQSAIAYGNHFLNGYLGQDLSASGWGLKWDFIIVHESAHEWFGNSITTKDIADSWVQEGFANYSETLFTTSEFGVEAGNDYVIGTRRLIENDIPIIGPYGVNKEGSADMYYKGGNMLHMIRQIVNDDEKFRQILRGLNKDFYHKTVTTAEIENYISNKSGIDFSKCFDQYLRSIQIPTFSYSVQQEKGASYLHYSWTNCIAGFDMPVKVTLSPGKKTWLKPKTMSQKIRLAVSTLPEKIVDRNFYVTEKRSTQN